MKHLRSRLILAVVVVALVAGGVTVLVTRPSAVAPRTRLSLEGRIVAVGIPGASAISAVGNFHPGGPIHDVARFADLTAPGRVLDPDRILVASSSNFGAAPGRQDVPPGSILSLDARASSALVVPPDFAAAADGQVSTQDGRIQLFTAQSASFLNGLNNSGAVTADLPPVSRPQAISINNGFGRLWFGNVPQGSYAAGSESIADADGRPLAGAPSKRAGGVFVGGLTNRAPEQRIPGALTGTVIGTALLGKSPDGSGRAVFAAVTADGGLAQIHTEQGVDGLSPAATITPLPESAAGEVPLRAGAVFNWVPNPLLYVADPLGNQVVSLALVDDGQVFRVDNTRHIAGPELAMPVDLAPAVPEIANPNFSSNTTLAGGSDLYVANRRDGTIARVRQDGTIVAVASVALPGVGALGPDRLNGVATSSDAQRLWVTVTGRVSDPAGSASGDGAVLELPAFGAQTVGGRPNASSDKAGSASIVARGEALFSTEFTPEDGLGPLFNARACVGCHQVPTAGGMASEGLGTVVRVGRASSAGFDPLVGRGGPVARAHSVAELGDSCSMQAGVPSGANVTSVRNAPALYGLGLLDAVPDQVIRAGAVVYSDGVQGRPNVIRAPDGVEHIGRFGWKADTPTLEEFVAGAFRTELGMTNPLAPEDLVPTPPGCTAAPPGTLDDDGSRVAAVTAFVAALDPPTGPLGTDEAGAALFDTLGCAECHTPKIEVAGRVLHPYTDLLLHDMGPALDDGVLQAQASGRQWRTSPLWGLSQRQRFLHDGRARAITSAINAHGGEAESAAQRTRQLSETDRSELLRFLGSL
jgi:cytochrome c551/c552